MIYKITTKTQIWTRKLTLNFLVYTASAYFSFAIAEIAGTIGLSKIKSIICCCNITGHKKFTFTIA